MSRDHLEINCQYHFFILNFLWIPVKILFDMIDQIRYQGSR